MWNTAAVMEPKVPDLYEFLTEAELQQYYNSLKNELKITNVTHLKYTTDEDLRQVSGLSRPEIRRLRKYYEKYYPHGYLNKIRRLLQTPRRDDSNFLSCVPAPSYGGAEAMTSNSSPNKIPNNKHIIPPDAICVNKQLGTGEFGIVQQGVWTNGSERIQVAIKCLCRERMQSNPMEFLKEAAMMHSIEHENIVRLYGVVLDTESLMLVTELAHLRSLLECLKDPGLRVSFLTVPTLCEFSLQICTGMMYLESKRFIHRDLAARNILVFNKNKVKISDFGLSRALGVGKDYYQTNFNVNLKLPIAWCAPECINFLRFTHASDVWAYGVCLWEIFSYGFQPWAALTGHQILEAIDEPHYQRLEKPECCPKEYYSMMLKCWQHDATKRPKFNDIFQALPDIKPEQLKTIVANSEQKKDYLMYRQGEIITVLDKNNNSPYWKGVLNSGKTGLFNPANTVAYLDSLPSSVNRESLCRTAERSSKRKIRTDMISRPQNDLKHTGHVGIDGVSFGDVAFLSSPQNLPRQIVTPYKPSEDLEQTPLLLPPTPTSPDSIQTASGYFSETLQLSGHTSFINAGENHHPHVIDHTSVAGLADAPVPAALSAFDFRNNGFNDSNPFINADDNGDTTASVATTYNKAIGGATVKDEHNQHEYHEISDDDMVTEKVLDQGPSLMDEMEHVFKSMSTISEQQPATPFSLSSSQDTSENSNMRNELTELSEKLGRKNSCSASGSATLGKSGGKSKSKHKTSTVKPISVKDEKLLNQAIEMANEISAKSMTDLVTDVSQQTMSPKRKFSFRFPHIHNVVAAGSDGLRCTSNGNITGNQSHVAGMSSVGSSSHAAGGRGLMPDKDHSTLAYAGQHHPHSSNATALANSYREKRNFSQEVNNVPDLQSTITEEARIAYNSLVENPSCASSGTGNGSSILTTTSAGGAGANGGCFTSSTLPRANKLTNPLTLATGSFRFKDIDCCTSPTEFAPKSPPEDQTSLLQDVADSAFLPGGSMKSKLFCILPRTKNLSKNAQHPMQWGLEEQLEDCNAPGKASSPSYLTGPEYTFSNALISLPTADMIHSGTSETTNGGGSSNNPIPLPPRDRNKTIPINQKRHVRKYPLIIPAAGVQRTLNKVTDKSPTSSYQLRCLYTATDTAHTFTDSNSQMADVHKTAEDGGGVDDDDDNDDNDVVGHDVDVNACNNLDIQQKPLESVKLSEIEQVGSTGCGVGGSSKFCLNVPEQLAQNEILKFSKEFVENNFPKLQSHASHVEDSGTERNELGIGHHSSSSLTTGIASTNTSSTPAELNTPAASNATILTRRHTAISSQRRQPPPPPPPGTLTIATAALRDPSYENLDIFQTHNKFCIDTASLHCESILENDTEPERLGAVPLGGGRSALMISEMMPADGFDNDDDSAPFHAITGKASRDATKQHEGGQPPTDGGELKKSINFVSCEDLLEFAEKPKGRARGLESDEVRIMSKVLGKKPSPGQCLLTLEFIDWDIHKAIKLCKLQNILESFNLSLKECCDALQMCDWDLHTAALKFKSNER